MSEVYLLRFVTDDVPLAFTSEKKARAVLWEAYKRDCIPMMKESGGSEEDISRWIAQDRQTFEDYGYIEDYGWITRCVVDEEEE